MLYCQKTYGTPKVLSIIRDHKQSTSKTGIFSSLEIYFGTITDMQDKYCGNCYDIYFIRSRYTKVVTRPSAAPPLLWFPLYWL